MDQEPRLRQAPARPEDADVATNAAGNQARSVERPAVTRSGRRSKPTRRLADYEVNLHGIECAQMSFRQIDEALTSGELEALVRVDPDPEKVQLAGLTATSAEATEAARRHETRLRKTFADVFSDKLTQCPPLRDQNFSLELTDNKPLPHRPPYALSEEGKRALMDMVDEMAEAGLIRPHRGPASCPIFLVKKKTLPGQPPRFRAVLDARPRNSQTAPRPFAAPRQDDVMPRLARARVADEPD